MKKKSFKYFASGLGLVTLCMTTVGIAGCTKDQNKTKNATKDQVENALKLIATRSIFLDFIKKNLKVKDAQQQIKQQLSILDQKLHGGYGVITDAVWKKITFAQDYLERTILTTDPSDVGIIYNQQLWHISVQEHTLQFNLMKSLQNADQNHPLTVHYFGTSAYYVSDNIVRDATTKDIGYFDLDPSLKKYADQIHFEGEQEQTPTDDLKLPTPGKSKKMSVWVSDAKGEPHYFSSWIQMQTRAESIKTELKKFTAKHPVNISYQQIVDLKTDVTQSAIIKEIIAKKTFNPYPVLTSVDDLKRILIFSGTLQADRIVPSNVTIARSEGSATSTTINIIMNSKLFDKLVKYFNVPINVPIGTGVSEYVVKKKDPKIMAVLKNAPDPDDPSKKLFNQKKLERISFQEGIKLKVGEKEKVKVYCSPVTSGDKTRVLDVYFQATNK